MDNKPEITKQENTFADDCYTATFDPVTGEILEAPDNDQTIEKLGWAIRSINRQISEQERSRDAQIQLAKDICEGKTAKLKEQASFVTKKAFYYCETNNITESITGAGKFRWAKGRDKVNTDAYDNMADLAKYNYARKFPELFLDKTPSDDKRYVPSLKAIKDAYKKDEDIGLFNVTKQESEFVFAPKKVG